MPLLFDLPFCWMNANSIIKNSSVSVTRVKDGNFDEMTKEKYGTFRYYVACRCFTLSELPFL